MRQVHPDTQSASRLAPASAPMTTAGRLFVACLMVVLALLYPATLAGQSLADDPRVGWLAANAMSIRSIDPDDEDFRDLEPLRTARDGVRLVLLGEADHGSGSDFLAKTRVAPAWAPNGETLYFRRFAPGEMMGVSYDAEPTFSSENPEVLFAAPYLQSSPDRPRQFDLSPDGDRFLMVKEGSLGGETTESHIVYVQHWFEELKERVPVN